MNIIKILDDYKENTPPGTYSAHISKIEEYISSIEDLDVSDSLDEAFLKDYIFSNDNRKAKGKHAALCSYYIFVRNFYDRIPKNKIIFPISVVDVKEFDTKNKINNNRGSGRSNVVYLEKGFDFKQLFNDIYYNHMNSYIAKITIKAAIALSLGAGYDSGELFKSNLLPKMKLNDFLIIDDKVQVTNFYASKEKHILLGGYLAEVIIAYYNIRKEFSPEQLDEADCFFVKMWDSKELSYDPEIKTHKRSKPYTVQDIVYYMFKYISKKIGIEDSLSVTDMRFNMVLHMLYQSKGSALKEIIKTFGLMNFVHDAISKYVLSDNSYSEFMFTDKSFFEYTPSEESEKNITPDGDKNSKEILISRLNRDSKIVKKLKVLYDNACQICGDSLTLLEDIKYSEACHIQPLGGHNGIDDESNILILCPNHHKLLDLGVICINPESPERILHMDKCNRSNHDKLKIIKHRIANIAIQYHYDNIFLKAIN